MKIRKQIMTHIDVDDLEKIDLLVEADIFESRDDFIRTAINKELYDQKHYIKSETKKMALAIGMVTYDAAMLREYQRRGLRLSLRVIGVLRFREDVTGELIEATIERVRLQGVIIGARAARKRLYELGRMY